MNEVKVPRQVLEETFNYLSTRPIREVLGLFNLIRDVLNKDDMERQSAETKPVPVEDQEKPTPKK